MKLVKEIAKEALKIFLWIVWLLSFWAGYMFMSVPVVMIICVAINTGCVVLIFYGLKDSETDEKEVEGVTEKTLEQAIQIKHDLDTERELKKSLENIIKNVLVHNYERAEFEINASIIGTSYSEKIFVCREVAEIALNKEIERSIEKIESLEAELDGLR